MNYMSNIMSETIFALGARSKNPLDQLLEML